MFHVQGKARRSICEKKLSEVKNNPINTSHNGPDVPTKLFTDNVKYTLLQTSNRKY